MPGVHLAERAVVKVSGEDAVAWLNNLVTTDVAGLEPGSARYGALLTPQGKILFDFLVTSVGHDQADLLLDVPRSLAQDLCRRLGFYRLRAKVAIADLSADTPAPLGIVAFPPGAPPPAGAILYADPRHELIGSRAALPWQDAVVFGDGGVTDYHGRRIGFGIPEGGVDFPYGDTFPHEALMDLLGGVDFRKGCYVGQEVVSRMQHRGTARTRVVPALVDGVAPPPGTEVTAGGKVVGRMGSAVGGRGLALLRLDRIEDAWTRGDLIRTADATLTPVKPDWWRAAWPGEQATSEA